MSDDKREPLTSPAQSETPGMPGNSMRENRETPDASAGRRTARRSPKRKSGMYVCGESSDCIVPAKGANKGQGTARRSTRREGSRPRRFSGTGRCWTQSQDTSVHYSAIGRTCGETRACLSPRWEPCAIGSQARVCAGGVRQRASLPRLNTDKPFVLFIRVYPCSSVAIILSHILSERSVLS